MKDGRVFEDRFFERTGKHVILYTNGRIKKSDIQSFSILKANLQKTAE